MLLLLLLLLTAMLPLLLLLLLLLPLLLLAPQAVVLLLLLLLLAPRAVVPIEDAEGWPDPAVASSATADGTLVVCGGGGSPLVLCGSCWAGGGEEGKGGVMEDQVVGVTAFMWRPAEGWRS